MTAMNVNSPVRVLEDCCLIRSAQGYVVVTPLGETHAFGALEAAEKDLLAEFNHAIDRRNRALLGALEEAR
jgi:hypothetical protein